MDALLKDLRYAARTLLRTPGFTIAAISALALGIATNTAIFTVINTVLLRPFAYSDPQRIVMFQNTFRDGLRSGSASPVEFDWWRRLTGAFQHVSAYSFAVANLTDVPFPAQIPMMRVSAEFFQLFGAHVLHGRTFNVQDDITSAPKTVVLAHKFWRRQFGSEPRVIGGHIMLGGERCEIVGVLGPNVESSQITEQSLGSGDLEINDPPDVYLPFQLDPNSVDRGHYFNVAARLNPEVTLAAANAQLEASYQEYARRWPDLTPGAGFGVQPVLDAIVGGVRRSLLLLSGAVSFVLLIACANVANLLLARATGRKHEIAIRAAVGASRGRIIRQLLTESVMLSLIAGVIGLAAGYAGIRAILSLIPGNIPRIGLDGSHVSIDWRVAGFTFGVSVLTGILFGLAPALQASPSDLSSALKDNSRGRINARSNRIRSLLVTVEMALALVLLIGAALLIRTFVAIRQVDSGFATHDVLTMRMSLTGPQFEKPAQLTQVLQAGVRLIRELPGVVDASATCCVPLEDRFGLTFVITGRPQESSRGVAGMTLVAGNYFETFKIPVLRGRAFTERDDSGPPVAVINQTLAKRYWPNSDPLKDQITIGRSSRRIIGVVGDVRDDALNRNPRANLYLLSAHMTDTAMLQAVPWAWVVRTHVPPAGLSSAIQHVLRKASGGLPVARIQTMDDVRSHSTGAQSFNMLVLTIFGSSALLLAAIGVYGLMAYSVAQRSQEIGIRLALGAESRHIRTMVMLQGLRPALIGVFCGLAAAFPLTRLIASFLFGVKVWDPSVFFTIPALLFSTAAIAVWLPAMRASRVDPIQALRSE